MSTVLAHSLVHEGEPRSWLLQLHGIYGRGNNWRTFARRLTRARPEWGVVLVDLRMHGDSRDLEPPHTVAAAAKDLLLLADVLRDQGRAVSAISGHSFGGKVALAARGLGPAWLEQTWMLDASPSARPGAIEDPKSSVAAVLRLMEQFPYRFDDRDQFVEHVTGRGFAPVLARWLAMNVEPADGGWRFVLDPSAMRRLLADYYALDLWPELEEAARPGSVHAVVAGASDAVTERDRERLARLEAESHGHIRYHLIEDAGHWLHIEALDRLVELVAANL